MLDHHRSIAKLPEYRFIGMPIPDDIANRNLEPLFAFSVQVEKMVNGIDYKLCGSASCFERESDTDGKIYRVIGWGSSLYLRRTDGGEVTDKARKVFCSELEYLAAAIASDAKLLHSVRIDAAEYVLDRARGRVQAAQAAYDEADAEECRAAEALRKLEIMTFPE